jgi:hypothetical protein
MFYKIANMHLFAAPASEKENDAITAPASALKITQKRALRDKIFRIIRS